MEAGRAAGVTPSGERRSKHIPATTTTSPEGLGPETGYSFIYIVSCQPIQPTQRSQHQANANFDEQFGWAGSVLAIPIIPLLVRQVEPSPLALEAADKPTKYADDFDTGYIKSVTDDMVCMLIQPVKMKRRT